MKNIKYIYLILLISSFVFTSCKKDDQEEIEETGDSFIVKVDGVELNNNDSKTYTGVGSDGDMELQITNLRDVSINLVMEVISVPDTGGDQMLLCIGRNCYQSVSAGDRFPRNSAGVYSYELAAGEVTTAGNTHVENLDDSNGDLEFVFELYEVDSDNDKLSSGTSLRFSYKYDAP